MEFTHLVFALLAGLFSVLSPCVLPLLPVVCSVAVAEHKLGAVALVAGLALSFLTVGLFVATIGFSLGVDGEQFRTGAAILLMIVGGVLVVPRLQTQVALAAGPLSNWAGHHVNGGSASGLASQFGVGLLLGAVWSPCVGPTLGAASVLAAQGRDLGHVALTMVMFAVGTACPLLLLGLLSREALMRWHSRLVSTGKVGKMVLGLVLITTGALILSSLDKSLETIFVQLLPPWLTALATGF
jgi:cytochrome c-type biogenesis protein